jgi:opacity protein-like surface antigen
MKTKSFFVSFALAFLSLAFGSIQESFAQDKWQYVAAASHGNKAEAFGLHLRPVYRLFDRIHVAPSVTFFGSSDKSFNVTQNVTSWNIDANYRLNSDDSLFEPYLLGGLNFSRVKTTLDGTAGTLTNKGTQRGVNIGAGADLKLLKRFKPFAEARYTIGGFAQFEIMAGIKI